MSESLGAALALPAPDSELERIIRGEPAPALLLPYQQYWVTDQARLRVFSKSRRIGITWTSGADAVLVAAAGQTDVWYVAYSEGGGKEFIQDCARWCEKLGQHAEHLVVQVSEDTEDTPIISASQRMLDAKEDGDAKGVRALQIRFRSGKRITVLTSSPRNLRGKKGRVIIDEAAFHDDLAELLKASTPLLMWNQGELLIISTHNGVDNPFNELCNDIRDGKRPDASLHECTITEALAQGLYQRICTDAFAESGTIMDSSPEGEARWLEQLKNDVGDAAQEELFCVPTGSGASYIGRALVERCMYEAPVLRFEQTDDWCALTEQERADETLEWCQAELEPLLAQVRDDDAFKAFGLGMDFARSADLSVIAPAGIMQSLKKRVPFMVEMRNIPHLQQWAILDYIMEGVPRLMFTAIDSGGNGSFVGEQAWLKHGGDDHVHRVQLSLGFYKEHMAPFKQSHEERLIQYPRDVDIMRDMAQIRRVNGVPKVSDQRTADAKKADLRNGGKRHGDAAIALFLAHVAARLAESMWARWEGLAAS